MLLRLGIMTIIFFLNIGFYYFILVVQVKCDILSLIKYWFNGRNTIYLAIDYHLCFILTQYTDLSTN